jgi:hypothetical protein
VIRTCTLHQRLLILTRCDSDPSAVVNARHDALEEVPIATPKLAIAIVTRSEAIAVGAVPSRLVTDGIHALSVPISMPPLAVLFPPMTVSIA